METHGFFQNSHKQVHAIIVCSCSGSSGHTKVAVTNESLYLHKHRPCSFHGTSYNRTRRPLRFSLQHILRRILYFWKSALTHFKNTNLIGWAKTVFHPPQNPIGCMTITFEIQNRIYHMFKHSWTRHHTFLRHMPHHKDSDILFLCKAHQNTCRLSYLGNATWCRGNIFIKHSLDRIDNNNRRMSLCNDTTDQIKVGLTQKLQFWREPTYTVCANLNLL